MRAALYVRVSTLDQNLDNQLDDLRKYVAQRGWGEAVEYADRASGAKDSRPALDALVKAARRRQFDVVVCWRLDRLGRNLQHLLTVLQELQALGVGFVSLNEGLTSPPLPAGSRYTCWAHSRSSSGRGFRSACAPDRPRQAAGEAAGATAPSYYRARAGVSGRALNPRRLGNCGCHPLRSTGHAKHPPRR